MSTEANKAVFAFLSACKDSGLKSDDVRKAFCLAFNIREADEQLEKHAEALANALAELRSLPAIPLNYFEKSGRALFPYLDFHDKKEGA